ncbi:MAG TPA: AlkA N-terminal domain-containing protein [Solirubrobacteraceae bacterium]
MRAVPGVEAVDGTVYRRAELAVDVRPDRVVLLDGDAAAARRLLDLDADPVAIDAVLAADPVLAPSVAAAPGRRVPGAVDAFEPAVRAILGQQVTVASARKLAARLVQACGSAPRFPSPHELLGAPDAAFAMPAARREALRTLARAAADDPGWCEPGALLALPGIGPWTAGYVAMRVHRDRDAFLPTDAGVRAGLRALGIDARRSDRWRPYRAHAMLHLWDHVPRPPSVARP